jgi:hypothetical protein
MGMSAPRVIALLVLVAAFSQPLAVAEQVSNRAEVLTIGVTVEPTCTVAVNAGERKPDGAIDLLCRNFRGGQPQPLLLEAEPREGYDVVLVRF